MRRLLLLLVAIAPLVAGCTGSFQAARIPQALLQGAAGNGWQLDASHSDAAPTSENGGLTERQTRAYADDGQHGNGGYPASVSLITLKLFPAPSEGQLRDILQQQVRAQSTASGINLSGDSNQGSRTLADGHRTLYFVFTGTVTGTGALFTTRDATAKILGEVWNCPERGTSVAAVGLAQISTVSIVGGVRLPAQQNPQNWRELAGDPQGTVDGQRDGSGLAYNAQC